MQSKKILNDNLRPHLKNHPINNPIT